MSTKLVTRLGEFMKAEKLNSKRLAEKLNYNSSEKISRLFREENVNPSCEIIENIANIFVNLDLNWLFTGRGNMFKYAEDDVLMVAEPKSSYGTNSVNVRLSNLEKDVAEIKKRFDIK